MSPIESGLFLAKKLIASFLLPPLLPLLLILLGLLLLIGRRRLGAWCAWAGLVLLVLASTPAVVVQLSAPLQAVPPVDLAAAKHAQAIVILGAGRNLAAPEYGGASAGRMVLERLRYGARLARQTGLPVLVTGGAPNGAGPSEAALMRSALEEDFQVPVRWVEDQSADTRDNARFSARMLSAAGVKRVVLVTHALHMRRAVGEFSAVGLEVLPAPTGYYDGGQDESSFRYWLPNSGGLYLGWFACHEWLGLLAQRLRP